MRQIFAVSLVVTIVLSSSYVYQLTSAICPIPLSYHIGTIDEGFDITAEEASAAAAAAAAVWEDELGRELFIETDQSSIAINFVFDERQARVVEEAEQRARLDVTSGTAEAVQARYDQLADEYQALQVAYEARVAAYNERLAEYNATIIRYNEAGGAPPDEFESLQAEDRALQIEGEALEQQVEDINRLVNQLNVLGDQGNDLITAFNREVGNYNQTFGESDEFTQGDFLGRDITVYTYTETDELVAVLAHEFGHSLGLGHVENEASVMYYLLGAQPSPLVLSNEDIAAFVTVCGESDGWSHVLARLSYLYTFN